MIRRTVTGSSLQSGKPKAAAATPAPHARPLPPSLGVDAADGLRQPRPQPPMRIPAHLVVYAGTQGLESIKRDLSHLSATSGPKSKHAYIRPSRLGPPQRNCGRDLAVPWDRGRILYRPAPVPATCEVESELTASADKLLNLGARSSPARSTRK